MSQDRQSELWIQIEEYIDQICSFDEILPNRYWRLSIDIVHYFLTTLPSATVSEKQFARGCRSNDSDNTVGGDLYYHIETCLENKLKNIYQSVNDMTEENVLRLYEIHCLNYKKSCSKLDGICQSLNRYWVRRDHDCGRRDIYEINVLAQQIWENTFFKPLFPFVTQACLNLIKEHRHHNSSIDTQSIKTILQFYLDQNLNEKIKDDSTMEPINDIYEQYFEMEFLRDAEDFYCQQKIPSFESNSMMEYLIQISEYFHQEINVAKTFLPESKSTLQMLIDKLEVILIRDYNPNMIEDKIKMMISTENNQDLALLYKAISRIPKIKNDLAEFMKNYIYEQIIESFANISTTRMNNFEDYIEPIYKIHQKYFTLLQKTVNTDGALINSLDKACQNFINRVVGDITKLPKLLTGYCDVFLRKGNKTNEENNIEEKFDQFMVIFNYVEDKDVYQKFYEKMLAKRLVSQLSVDDDYEELMILKLKQTCGYEYTSKFERMFQDINVSKTLIDEYRTYSENKNLEDIVDFSVMVLSSNSWPFSAPPNLIVPIELKSTFDSFTEFYTHRHNGRKLTWLHQHSKGELQTFFTTQKYTLQLSTYQMIILLLFNKRLNWTVEQIQDETQIKIELLLQVLCGLLKSKILICTEINKDELDEDLKESDIKINYSIRLMNDFKSKKIRINLNVPIKSVEQKDMEGVHRTIDEDRKMVIQAAIVRTMKARQTLKHALLMQEVIQELSSRFKPKIPVIKKCIDILIEKEYLERQSNEKDILRYLA